MGRESCPKKTGVVDSNLNNGGGHKNRSENQTFLICYFSWLTFAETFRTIYMDISPLRFKEIRELVDDYEAGRLDLTEVKER